MDQVEVEFKEEREDCYENDTTNDSLHSGVHQQAEDMTHAAVKEEENVSLQHEGDIHFVDWLANTEEVDISDLEFPNKPAAEARPACRKKWKLSSLMMPFCVVEFCNAELFEVLPTAWLVGKERCHWPTNKICQLSGLRKNNQKRLVKAMYPSVKSWPTFGIRVLKYFDSYEKASRHLSKEEETDHFDANIKMGAGKGKNKKKVRKNSEDSDDSTDVKTSYSPVAQTLEVVNHLPPMGRIVESELDSEIDLDNDSRAVLSSRFQEEDLQLGKVTSSKRRWSIASSDDDDCSDSMARRSSCRNVGPKAGPTVTLGTMKPTAVNPNATLQGVVTGARARVCTNHVSSPALESACQAGDFPDMTDRQLLEAMMRSVTEMAANQKKMLREIQLLKAASVSKELDLVPETESSLPDLPAASLDELSALDELLLDEEIFKELVSKLRRLGGLHLTGATKLTMCMLMTNQVAMQVTWEGTHSKASIGDTAFIRAAVEAISKVRACANVERSAIKKSITEWLRHASQRMSNEERKVAKK